MPGPDVLSIGIDIGSVRRPGGFAWADASAQRRGTDDPSAVARVIEGALEADRPVAIAIEAPLSVPVPTTAGQGWRDLGRARTGEGNRSWSAGAGSGSLATGLAQLTWILTHIAEHTTRPVRTTVDPDRVRAGGADLFIAEAMVTAAGKPEPVDDLGDALGQDLADAVAAARRLEEVLRDAPEPDGCTVVCAPAGSLNLAIAAALRAGLEIGPDELAAEILVARVLPVTGP